jgi:hypothetical protein
MNKCVLILPVLLFSVFMKAQDSAMALIRPIHIGLIYPLSTNGTDAPNIRNRVSLHAFGGVSAGEEGLCLSGFGHITRGNLSGLQAAGFGNIVDGQAAGLLLAGFGNVSQSVKGMQYGGFGNISKRVEGIQVAGFGNITGDMLGIQSASFGNIAENLSGVQVAGFMNIAEVVEGAQFASFMNIAGKVKGLQAAGFMNIADSSDFPIGFINIIRNGHMHVQASVDEMNTIYVDFRSGGRFTYGFIGVGLNFSTGSVLPASQAGIGVQIPFLKSLSLRPEVVVGGIYDIDKSESVQRMAIRALGDIYFDRLHLFAGPSLSVVNSNLEGFSPLISFGSWTDDNRSYFAAVGYTVGISYRIRG